MQMLIGFVMLLVILLGQYVPSLIVPSLHTTGTIKIYDKHGELIFENPGKIRSRRPVPLTHIPLVLQKGVVLIEDGNFYSHVGVDFFAIARAVFVNIFYDKPLTGASTITQQLVRFLIINPYKQSPTSVIRKIQEIILALRLDRHLSKQSQLELYLNNIHFGYDYYGVESAAYLYFDKPVRDITISQAAMLISLISNPSTFSYEKHKITLTKLLDQKIITQEEFALALEEKFPAKPKFIRMYAPHFTQMVLQDNQVQQANTKNQGLNVFTTLDLQIYALAQAAGNKNLIDLKREFKLGQIASVIIENKTGNIVSLSGSADLNDVDGQNNMANALRQPGSALKPLVYALAFEKGLLTPETLLTDAPSVYTTSDSKIYAPQNYDRRFRGEITAKEALASSSNLAAVEVLAKIGIENFLSYARLAGITTFTNPERYDLAVALGGAEVTLTQLTNLYAMFARDGFWLPYRYINRITDDLGHDVYKFEGLGRQVFSPTTAKTISDILSDNLARMAAFGQRSNLYTPFVSSVKTGTTTDWRDNWTVGYTNKYTVGVWAGNPDNSPMSHTTGVTGAAPVWNTIMTNLHKNDRQTRDYITLTSKIKPDVPEKIQIIFPTNNGEYLSDQDEYLIFSTTPNKNIERVDWSLPCQTLEIYTCKWQIKPGAWNLNARVFLTSKESVSLDTVTFNIDRL